MQLYSSETTRYGHHCLNSCPLEPEEMAVLLSVFCNDPFDDLDGDMGTSLYIIREFVRCVELHNQT